MTFAASETIAFEYLYMCVTGREHDIRRTVQWKTIQSIGSTVYVLAQNSVYLCTGATRHN